MGGRGLALTYLQLALFRGRKCSRVEGMQRLIFPFIWVLVLLSGCEVGGPGNASADTYFPVAVGSAEVSVQLAVAPEELRRGLMYRESLGPNEGMLFVFPGPKQMSFWMRNTKIPLDIGYFDSNGVLKEIYPLYPLNETPVRSRSQELQFALEVNQGWFAEKGVRPGQRLDLEALREALVRRGLDPIAIGI